MTVALQHPPLLAIGAALTGPDAASLRRRQVAALEAATNSLVVEVGRYLTELPLDEAQHIARRSAEAAVGAYLQAMQSTEELS